MDKQDEMFNEAYKPIHVPANFNKNDSLQDQLIFALAEIGKGSVKAIAEKLSELGGRSTKSEDLADFDHILTDLYDRGLIKGSEQEGRMVYNLSKETVPHKGNVNPRLL
ncbi:hypothetical protein H8S90_17800 [Olivibacter sp. SDN3]|uniref:hypothetical protein n=1 Tax=Olivibacter sp. SDN3 TaxID=2764720 RepID=UPI0016517977|nr:hypothetical protein [Olivibacter sp. SDN3]QNL48626.1 hypothetical protein H8S90_17800 [Olivibacter sp. SDN3]